MANLKDTLVLGDLTATGKITAGRIESQNDKLYIGKALRAGDGESQIQLFGDPGSLDNYSTLIGSVITIPASTWMKVATVGLYGTVIVIGAGYNSSGGFVAMATNQTLHVHYKTGCVTDVRVTTGREVEIYTNGNVPEMRILCMKVYD